METMKNLRSLPRILMTVGLLALLASCNTTGTGSADSAGKAVKRAVHAYRACALKSAVAYLASETAGGPRRAADAVNSACETPLTQFEATLTRLGVDKNTAANRKNKLRTVTMKHTKGAILAMMLDRYSQKKKPK